LGCQSPLLHFIASSKSEVLLPGDWNPCFQTFRHWLSALSRIAPLAGSGANGLGKQRAAQRHAELKGLSNVGHRCCIELGPEEGSIGRTTLDVLRRSG